MTDICDLPHLEVVPLESLVLHEHHDPQRTPPLKESLFTSGILRNPPIVLQISAKEDRYIVLDGANRVMAFIEAEIPHIVVQVVQIGDPDLELASWNHVIWGIPPVKLLSLVRETPKIKIKSARAERNNFGLTHTYHVASIQLPDEKIYFAFTSVRNPEDRVIALNAIVDSYRILAQIDRTMVCQIELLFTLYPQLSGLVILPSFTIEDVIDFVDAGYRFPPGVTRFKISPRVLRINYSLDALKAPITTAEKKKNFQNWLQSCLEQKSVRYYAESTFVFNE